MTNMLFLPTESLLNQKINKGQEVKKFLPSKEALRCQTNSPCQYQKKHFGNIIEHNDVGVDHLTAKISFEILLTVCHTIIIMLVWII